MMGGAAIRIMVGRGRRLMTAAGVAITGLGLAGGVAGIALAALLAAWGSRWCRPPPGRPSPALGGSVPSPRGRRPRADGAAAFALGSGAGRRWPWPAMSRCSAIRSSPLAVAGSSEHVREDSYFRLLDMPMTMLASWKARFRLVRAM